MAKVNVFRVLSPGPLTTIQDLGRFGWGRYGVAPSGAVDHWALRLGNSLLGNPDYCAGLEITVFGFKAEVLAPITVAVTGGDLSARLNDQPLPLWQATTLHPGEKIHFPARRTGCRAYLTVEGGLSVPPILGSRATNISAGFGGLDGRPLKKGDVLSIDQTNQFAAGAITTIPAELIPTYGSPWALRVILGPQDDHFTPQTQETFFTTPYQVGPNMDRTGIRLIGSPLPRRENLPESILSEGLVPGVIQVPGDGQPIIVLAETVTGGYRKIGGIISADLSLLGQLFPGDVVCFQPVTLKEAREAIGVREARMASCFGIPNWSV